MKESTILVHIYNKQHRKIVKYKYNNVNIIQWNKDTYFFQVISLRNQISVKNL